jgi:succinyl-CoA synthetase alpha subunit
MKKEILTNGQASAMVAQAINPEIEAKVQALLSEMTLEEKVGQMTQIDVSVVTVPNGQASAMVAQAINPGIQMREIINHMRTLNIKKAKHKGPGKTGRNYAHKGTKKLYEGGYNKSVEISRRLSRI